MATPSAVQTLPDCKFERIPLDLIDEPTLPERETMDEQELAELALSIADVGLVEPLVVKIVDKRFEVVAGHRRLLACRLVNYSPVPCMVRMEGDIDHLAILIAENAHREDVNAIEEARFYARVLTTKADNDVDQLCALVRRKRAHVEDRLILLQGYPAVIDALHQRRISIAVARGLNKCQDPVQLTVLLNVAITQGATARQVSEWVRDANGLPPIELPPADPNHAANVAASAGVVCSMECIFCQSGKHTHQMSMAWLHHTCRDMLEQMLGRGAAANNGG